MNTLPTNRSFTLYERDPLPESFVRELQRVQRQAPATLLMVNGSSRFQQKQLARRIAAQLGKSMYQVALERVSDEYIGETEKNLQEMFERASQSGWILLFDEADALFGKRSEVQDSHDRYANAETSYLQPYLSRHRGIIITLCGATEPATLKQLQTRRITVRLRSGTPRKGRSSSDRSS